MIFFALFRPPSSPPLSVATTLLWTCWTGRTELKSCWGNYGPHLRARGKTRHPIYHMLYMPTAKAPKGIDPHRSRPSNRYRISHVPPTRGHTTASWQERERQVAADAVQLSTFRHLSSPRADDVKSSIAVPGTVELDAETVLVTHPGDPDTDNPEAKLAQLGPTRLNQRSNPLVGHKGSVYNVLYSRHDDLLFSASCE